MPKDQYNIISFSGGINNKTDSRNIGQDQSEEMVNVESSLNLAVDKKGKLKLSGALNKRMPVDVISFGPGDFHESTTHLHEESVYEQMRMNKGNGLFIFSHDYKLLGSSQNEANFAFGGQIQNAHPTLICFYRKDSIGIFDSTTGGILGRELILAWEGDDAPEAIQPEYTYYNGALIVVDSNFNNESTGSRLVLVNDVFLQKQITASYSVKSWVVLKNEVIDPHDEYSSMGILSLDGNLGEADLPNKVRVDVIDDASSGSISGNLLDNKIFYVGISFVLEDGMHTRIHEAPGSVNTSTFSYNPRLAVRFKMSNDYPWSPEISGFHIWLREGNESEYFSYLQVDLKLGTWISYAGGNDIDGHQKADIIHISTGDDAHMNYCTTNGIILNRPSPVTYKSVTGYYEEDFVNAQYKTSVVNRGILYAGNVKQDKGVHSDRIIKSLPGAPVVTPTWNVIDVASDDGDQIIKLNAFADRILQFKKNKLFIINVSEDQEFLEGEYPNYGVSFKSASCDTPIGVAFANRSGVYMYTGKEIIELLAPQGLYLISKDDWDEFTYTEDMNGDGTGVEYEKHLFTGYEPTRNKLHIYNDFGDGYSISLSNGAISQTKDRFHNSANCLDLGMSNIVTHNGNMYAACLDGSEIFAYDSTGGLFYYDIKPQEIPASDDVLLKTKDIDFNSPGLRKKIHRIYITYKCDNSTATGVKVEGIYTNNSGVSTVTFKGEQNADNSGILAPQSNDAFFKAILIPNTSLNSIYSLQLVFKGVTNAKVDESFEIDDISITYRIKGVR